MIPAVIGSGRRAGGSGTAGSYLSGMSPTSPGPDRAAYDTATIRNSTGPRPIRVHRTAGRRRVATTTSRNPCSKRRAEPPRWRDAK